MKFYVSDPTDPLIRVWQNAFPHLFTPATEAPQEIQQHFRYPEDLMTVQASEFTRYHVTDTSTFYSNERVWAIPTALATQPGATPPDVPFRPYYVLSKIPGSDSEHFVLFEPFIPPKRTNMVAYLAAGSDDFGSVNGSKDPGLYGNLTSLQFPTNGNVVGPAQARSLINQDPTASAQITLLNAQGSNVLFGDMIVVPLADSFIYVQPIFLVSSQTNAIPQLKLVAVVNGGDVFLGTNLSTALANAFGQQTGGTCPDGSQPPCPTPTGSAADLLAQAEQQFKLADAALKAGDLAGYQSHIKTAQQLITQAAQLLAAAGSGPGTGGTGGTATPTPTPTVTGTP
jgi:uncharacterized membrane protein (UPF0182 family)